MGCVFHPLATSLIIHPTQIPSKVGTAEVDDGTRLFDIGLIREYFTPETKMKLHRTRGILEPVSYTKHGEDHKKPNTYHHESFSGMSLSL